MIVRLKKVRKVWAYCQNNREHGNTPYELSMNFGLFVINGRVRVWLCEDCLISLFNQYEDALNKRKLLPKVKVSTPLILRRRTLPKLRKRAEAF